MEANRGNNRREYDRTSYVDGNTVRKLNTQPDRREEQYEIPSPRRQDNRQTMALPGINIPSLMILTVAIVATLVLCVNYIRVQSDINRIEKEIATTQEKLITLTKSNDAAYEEIKATDNLDYVYRVAVEEYGMIYPGDDNLIKYQGSDDDYVRQYEDIPK
jgi:cell division protein FtsL